MTALDQQRQSKASVSGAAGTVFVRTFSTPPGLPWEQARIADLEARSAAPLPLGDVHYRLRRLETWGPSRPARFAALYVRASETGDRFSAKAQVDGREITIEFLSRSERERQMQQVFMLIAPIAVAAAITLSALTAALSASADATDALSELQTTAAADLRNALLLDHARRDARTLDQLGMRDHTAQRVIDDLNWLSHTRSPNAHLDAVYWEPRAMALEVRGPAPPFDGPSPVAVKAAKPQRPGVSLWGVSRAVQTAKSP